MKIRIIGAIISLVLAAVGTVLLLTYVNSADRRASEGAEFVSVYVVTEKVPVGTTAQEIGEYIEIKEIPAIAVADGRVTNLRHLRDLVTDVTLQPGEQLLAARWVDPKDLTKRGQVELPEGMQAVTIALQVERVVGGVLKAGDTVGVVVSTEAEDATTGKPILLTKQSFHKVLVLEVQPGSAFLPGDEEGERSSDPVDVLMVTLARTTPDIEVLVWGQEWGKIWLTLEPETATEEGGRNVDVNVVFQ